MTRSARHAEDPFRYVLPIETRFRDTDAMGHINNAVYLTYFEAARAGYYTAVTGRSFEGIADDPVSIILVHATVDFRAQAWYGERLLVACRATWAGHSSFAFGYRVTADVDSTRGPGRVIAEGETIQVMFDYATQRPTRIPADLLAQIAAFEGGPIPPRP
jgi:acyl-CoA thioester hydrolase